MRVQKSNVLAVLGAAILSFALGAMAHGIPPESSTAAPHDYKTLVVQLKQSGLRVEKAGGLKQAFFTQKARVIRINPPGEAQVYEYADGRKAASEAARVNADGSIGTSMPMWVAPPHFYRKDRLIVLYLGSDQSVLNVLSRLLGPQFAGR